MANYMLVGAKSLGCQIFEVKDGVMTLNFDKEAYASSGTVTMFLILKAIFLLPVVFRSDDIKTGNILAYVAPLQVPPSSRISHN